MPRREERLEEEESTTPNKDLALLLQGIRSHSKVVLRRVVNDGVREKWWRCWNDDGVDFEQDDTMQTQHRDSSRQVENRPDEIAAIVFVLMASEGR